jgi:predicted component of type VI protein secretion system
MIATRHESAVLPVANLIAKANAMLGTLVTMPLDHPDFDRINARWIEIDALIPRTPSKNIQDQVAQLRHLVTILVNFEEVSPYAESLARKALAEMEAMAAN